MFVLLYRDMVRENDIPEVIIPNIVFFDVAAFVLHLTPFFNKRLNFLMRPYVIWGRGIKPLFTLRFSCASLCSVYLDQQHGSICFSSSPQYVSSSSKRGPQMSEGE